MVTVQDMNIRDGPGTHYLPLAILPQGISAQIVGKAAPLGAIWWKIVCPEEISSDQCWVSGGEEFVTVRNADGVADAPIPPAPLERQDIPPQGIAAQIGVTIGIIPGPPCLGSESAPTITTMQAKEILKESVFCMYGFAYSQAIQVEIMRPDGSVIEAQVDRGERALPWVALPGDPLGVYAITAREGQLQATANFTVGAASAPRILVSPEMAPPGTQFQVAIAGYSPGQQPMSLYRRSSVCKSGETCWNYLTHLTTVNINDRGEALYTLRTVPGDPEGSYRIFVGAPPDSVSFTDTSGNFDIGS
jgi:hypothetical protein